MKSLFALFTLVGSLSFAAATIEPGTYKATDVDTGTIIATLVARADKTVNFTVTAPDFEMPAPGCTGSYAINGNILTADMTCPLDFLPEAKVTIDITTVTPESVRQDPGALVNVVIDALGADAYPFYFRKIQ